jgi:hypothetical protein
LSSRRNAARAAAGEVVEESEEGAVVLRDDMVFNG